MCTILVIILLLHVLIHWVFLFPSFSFLFSERNTHLRPSYFVVVCCSSRTNSRRDTLRYELFPAVLVICLLFTTAYTSNRLVYRFDRTIVVEFKKRNPATPLVFRHPSYLCAFCDGTQTAPLELPSGSIIKRYVNTITATSIQIKVGVQLPTPSYGTGSTARPFVSFRL